MTNFFDNMGVKPQLVGLETLLAPFAAHTSSQRLAMLSSHVNQALVLHGNEPPRIGSGFETRIGSYEFNPTTRDQDIQIIEIIPKYVPGQGAFPIRENPMTTVVFRGCTDNTVGYFNLENFTKCMDGYGYRNQLMNTSFLTKDNFVPKEIQFMTSPTHHGNFYGLGVNANVLYISLAGVTEDAFVISKSLARKMWSTAIKEMNFRVSPDEMPLNIYGDENEYRFMPDIGERVREDGLLCCFRKPDASTFISDIMNASLVTPQPLHDATYMVPYAGATVIDIDIDINRHYKNKIPREAYSQVHKYKDNINIYHRRIVEAYRAVTDAGYRISPAFNTLIYRSMAQLMAEGLRVPGAGKRGNVILVKKKDPIEFLNMKITYQFDNVVSNGFKISGREGNKGVVCCVMDDELMPLDAYGIQADILMDGGAVFNRMNPSQLYEQFITRTDEFVRRRVAEIACQGTVPIEINTKREDMPTIEPNVNGAWTYLHQYLTDVNPNYGELVERCHQSPEQKNNLIKEVIDHGIYHFIPPTAKHIDSEWVLFIADKYPAPPSPVTFKLPDIHGNLRQFTTIEPMYIGGGYKYLLYKIPHLKSSGVGYINQHRTPIIASSAARQLYPIGQTPLRTGEDEIRNLIMVAGPETVARFVGIYANSTDAVEMMINMQLNESYPTRIARIPMSTEQIMRTNNMAAMTQHLMSTAGIDITTKVQPQEAVDYATLVLPETEKV